MENNEKKKKQIYSSMAALCSRSEQCSGDIRKKIITAGLTDDEAEELITKLIDEKFIDDNRYINAYITDKFRLNRWGKIKIKHYLKIKKLPTHLIQEGLDKIDPEEYKLLLINTLEKKAKTVKNRDHYSKLSQIIRFAENRGFEPELIHRYLDQVVS